MATRQQTCDLEALRHLGYLAHGAQIEQEVVDLIGAVHAGEHGEQLIDERSSEFVSTCAPKANRG